MESIAIDGPSGVGKSTVATELARRLNMKVFDSGAIYRAFAIAASKAGIADSDEEGLYKLFDVVDINVKHNTGTQRTYLNGEDVTSLLKIDGVGPKATKIASYPRIRIRMNDAFKKLGVGEGYVIEGRDIGTYLLPHVKIKFYLTASPEVRAKRRYDQFVAGGQQVDYNTILKQINDRDYLDMHREVAPLKKAPDAIEIDSSNMNVFQTVLLMLNKITEKRQA